MASCRLCGYRGHSNTNAQCPVCGEAYDRPQDGNTHGSKLAQAAGGSWCGMTNLDGCNTEGAKGSTHLNLDLQSLLHLIPEQHDRKKRAQRDVVRATEAGLAPTQANNGRRDPDVVYIQPRVDPTMTVLKGRYKTQPRLAKAASMSVLNRLAHPLMGYDSMGALAPKARKRRQESVERILGQALSSEKVNGGGQARRLNKSRSAVELSEPLGKSAFLRRRSSGGGIPPRAPMAVSVNAVHLYGRKKSAGSGAHQQRRQDRRGSGGRLSQTHEVAAAASPLLRLRASEGRRAKPNLRRKRVATMRSVGGWVRESDPTSTRRQVSLDRRVVALRKKQNQRPRDRRKESRTIRNPSDARRHSNSDGGGGTFLTEIETETDGALGVPETGLSQGNGEGIGSWVNGRDVVPRRRGTVKGNTGRQYPRVREGGSISATAQRQQARRRSSGAEGGPCSTDRRRRATTTVTAKTTPGRSRSEGTRVKARAGRTKSLGALDRYGDQHTSPSRVGQQRSSVGRGAGERIEEGRVGQAPVPAAPPPQPPEWSGELNAGRVVRGSSADWTPSHPGGAWNSPSPGRTTDGVDAPGAAELAVRSSSAKGTDAHETDTTMAPAWGVLGSYATLPLPEDVGGRLEWQGDEPGASTCRPRSEWQLLRGGGANPLSRSAELLQSFENKVGAPVSKDQGRRPASAAGFVSNGETAPQQQQQQQQPLMSEGEHDGGRRRHHRPLSREEEEEEKEARKEDGTPRLPSSKSSLASMHSRPASSSWVHRRSLPSLLSRGTADGSSWTQRANPFASTPPPREPSGGGAAQRKRGKRRTPLEEPSGRMLRLDKTPTTVTVGDAFARSGGSLRGAGDSSRGQKSSETEVVSPGALGEGREATRAATPPQVDFESGLDGRADSSGSSRRGGTPSGKLLSSAIAKPLLYVGSGGGFRLRS